MQLVFELDSMKSSKELWSTSREYAEFYTEPKRRIQEEPDPQSQSLRIIIHVAKNLHAYMYHGTSLIH